MRKTLLLLFYLASTVALYAQDFPGRHYGLLLNKELIVKPLSENLKQFGYQNFYTVRNFSSIADKRKIIYNTSDGFSTRYDALENKTFTVSEITPHEGIYGRRKAVLSLHNDEIGTIYYEYDSERGYYFPFEVKDGLASPEGYFCTDISEKVDKFTGEIKYYSPTVDGIMFLRVKSKEFDVTYMYISEEGSTLNVGENGLILLLSDGSKIEKPNAKIDVDSEERGWLYSAFVELTDEDKAKLSKYEITDNRLYVYDGIVHSGKVIKEYLKCILAK